MRCFRNTFIGVPETISTTRASTSIPSDGLYIQREPGWNSRGVAPSRGM